MADEKIGFGLKVRLARTLLNYRQDALAKAMGVSPVTMSRWEHGTQVPHAPPSGSSQNAMGSSSMS